MIPVEDRIASVEAPSRKRRLDRWLAARVLLPWLLIGGLAFQIALIPVPRGDGLLIGSDGIEYYIHLRSLAIDRDIDFANEYRHFAHVFPTPRVNALGRTPNKHAAVGVVLLWLPFFLAAHALVLLIGSLGVPIAADGYNYVYQAAVCIGSAVYGALGCLIAYRAARRYYPERPAVLAVTVLWLASNAFYFMVFEPSMVHMLSLFAVSSALTVWLFRLRDVDRPPWREFAVLGLAGGLVLTVRTQDAVFLGIPLVFIGARWLDLLRRGDRRGLGHWSVGMLIGAAVALTLLALQLYTWQQLYGVWNESPMQRDDAAAFRWADPHLAAVLFSTYHGLFTWHPVTLFATGGLLLFHRRDPRLANALGLAFLVHAYVVAAWWGWAQGDSFGGRVFLNCLWLWVMGLSALFAWIAPRRRLVVAAMALSMALIAWNALSLIQYRLGFIAAASQPTNYEMTVGRLLVPSKVIELVRRRIAASPQQ